MFDNIFALGRKTYNKAFLMPENKVIGSSMHLNILQKEAIGKPFQNKNKHFLFNKENRNDVRQHLRRARSGGTVAPAKKSMR